MVASSQTAEVIDFNWGRIEWLVSHALGNSDAMTFGRVTIKAGHANARHIHPNCDEILYVVSGRLLHSLGDQKQFMEPGDTLSIPLGVAHNAESVGPDDAVMVMCFSSAYREAYNEE